MGRITRNDPPGPMTQELASKAAPQGALPTVRRLIAENPVTAYIILSSITQVVMVALQHYDIRNYGMSGLRPFTPAIIGVVVGGIAFGKATARKYLTSLLEWRLPLKFYAFAFLYPPVVAFTSLGVLRLIGLNETIHLELVELTKLDLFTLTVKIAIVEEIAWVGFLLSTFARRWRLFSAAAVTGAVWGIWYIPLILTEIQVTPGLPILPLIVNFMTIAVICAWLYYRTRSAFIVCLMQITTNYTGQVIPVLPERGGITQYVAFVILKSLLAAVLFVFWGPKPLFGSVPEGRSALDR